MKTIKIYTDGACSGNPGPGGWGAILIFGDHRKEISGGDKSTTNNRMEMLAVIKALDSLSQRCKVTVVTDSKYVQQGVLQWMPNWKRNNWRTANKKPVKNKDLWQKLDASSQAHDLTIEWIKGHSGHPMNDRADELATGAIPG